MPIRVLFARIGWMTFYCGVKRGDSKVIGGGSYNTTGVGSEQLNFSPIGKRLNGFVQSIRSHPLKLERIARNAGEADSLDGVLVVFIAQRPGERGQVVVGWYQDATVYRDVRPDPRRTRAADRVFNVQTSKSLGVLLPTNERYKFVPGGKGAFGQANVCYSLESNGKAKKAPWMKAVIEYTRTYRGANILAQPEIEEQNQSSERADAIRAASQGQGFAATATQRRAIEQLAMKRALAHFRKHYQVVTNTSQQKGVLDLCCGSAAKKLRVEVKGTTTTGESVILTRREVERARTERCALFVLHSIELDGDKAKGGTAVVIPRWRVDEGQLTPINFTYKLP